LFKLFLLTTLAIGSSLNTTTALAGEFNSPPKEACEHALVAMKKVIGTQGGPDSLSNTLWGHLTDFWKSGLHKNYSRLFRAPTEADYWVNPEGRFELRFFTPLEMSSEAVQYREALLKSFYDHFSGPRGNSDLLGLIVKRTPPRSHESALGYLGRIHQDFLQTMKKIVEGKTAALSQEERKFQRGISAVMNGLRQWKPAADLYKLHSEYFFLDTVYGEFLNFEATIGEAGVFNPTYLLLGELQIYAPKEFEKLTSNHNLPENSPRF
ncbi:MAG: hypothetical protein AB1540_14955, partial [Bdellovibrionota bacterium]